MKTPLLEIKFPHRQQIDATRRRPSEHRWGKYCAALWLANASPPIAGAAVVSQPLSLSALALVRNRLSRRTPFDLVEIE
jgi:hypothetical protein